ncbi:hypothetical protein B0T10DRAFT_455075 [Thelonectria olida]|uniref:Repetitive proline-rich cell wall protein n=1 Tax=Thelonectria olida TaxID=1576542 RepID=A0A9P9AUD2_9HYPO|nr:hypothetical protein B0T10DRAFT_455075 [Thelonectria olida]
MKFGASLLLLATSAVASQLQARGDDYDDGDYGDDGGDYGDYGDYGDEATKTIVTYTTVTTCPVTSTYTREGSTYCVTQLTTSTVVVTECKNCEGVTTVEGPDYTKTEVDVEYTTRTTVCPVTETKTVGGKEVTVVYTTTSVIEEAVHTTDYEEVTYPGPTKTEVDVKYTTRTTVCPVTITTEVEGKPTTYVYTTTSVIEEAVHTTDYEEITKPGPTYKETEVEYTTRTTVCPVTITTEVEGKPTTYVTTTTSVIEEAIHTTDYEEITKPGKTYQETEVEYTTRTTVCPVTVTTTVEGKPTTYVTTTTSVIEEKVQKTDYEAVTEAGPTEYQTEVEYTTRTTVCPVTVTTTIKGKPTTLVYTTTSLIEEKVQKTDYEAVTEAGPTEYQTEVEYTTRTTVCPVTVTTTIKGKPTTLVYTTTSLIEEKVQKTDYEAVTEAGNTEYQTEVEYSTRTTVCPVTITTTIAGKEETIVYTTTSIIEEAIKTTVIDKVQQPDTTKYKEEVAYVTKTSLCPVTETQTIAGEVITKVYTTTEYLVTQVKTTINEYQTIYQTASKAAVYTQYSKVYVTVGGGTVIETIVPQTTVQVPETEVVTQPAVTYTTPASAPTHVSTGAADAMRPAFALLAGLAGALALL